MPTHNPAMNDINFPAGISAAAFLYDFKIDPAVNPWRGIGVVIGHEMTHALRRSSEAGRIQRETFVAGGQRKTGRSSTSARIARSKSTTALRSLQDKI